MDKFEFVYSGLVVPYLPQLRKAIFIKNCESLDELLEQYKQIEFVSDKPERCFDERHDSYLLYDASNISGIIVEHKE